MRTLGALAVVSAAFGFYATGENRQRRSLCFLQDTLDAVRHMAGDVRTYHVGLPTEFAKFAENGFFARILASQTENPEQALFVSVSKAAEELPPEEREILTRLGGGLVGDEESLQLALARAENDLTALVAARREKAKNERRIRAAAVSSLAAMLLLLLL